ncbi:MAG: hypothetical protein ABSD52_01490 [Candidatus Cybelea sp.]|jgi:hypothetical protein
MSDQADGGVAPNAYPGPYKARFPPGCVVQVADEDALRHFKATWKYHHPLDESQLQFAGLITAVCGIGYYHGGDVLYQLRDTRGYTWHEDCLRIPGEVQSTAQEMGTCRDLDLVKIEEPGTNCLRLLIAELTPGVRSDIPQSPVEGARLNERGSRDRLFEVTWSRYVAYNVLNESYAGWDESEEFQGTSFRLYSKSHYLDFLKTAENVQNLAPAHRHWRIVCVKHIIDVASEEEPNVARYGKA